MIDMCRLLQYSDTTGHLSKNKLKTINSANLGRGIRNEVYALRAEKLIKGGLIQVPFMGYLIKKLIVIQKIWIDVPKFF